jgi:hypothetical protein
MDEPRAYAATAAAIMIDRPTQNGAPYFLTRHDVRGPVFPVFASADLSTLDGFLACVAQLGLDGFAFLDETHRSPFRDTIARALQEKHGLLAPVALKHFYDRIREPLATEQTLVKRFQSWFVEGAQPTVKRPPKALRVLGEDHVPVVGAALAGASLGYFPPKGSVIQRDVYAARELLGSIERHLSQVSLTLSAHHSLTATTALRVTRPGTPLGILYSETERTATGRKRRAVQRGMPLGILRVCPTVPARCYLEMLDLLADQREVKRCTHCDRPFVRSDPRGTLCEGIAPEYLTDWRKGTLSTNALLKKTCKVIGPQVRFWETKTKTELADLEQKKQYQNRLAYLKRTGQNQTTTSIAVKAEYQRWKEAHANNQGGRDGTTKRKRSRAV